MKIRISRFILSGFKMIIFFQDIKLRCFPEFYNCIEQMNLKSSAQLMPGSPAGF
jgi:hypothetical protein